MDSADLEQAIPLLKNNYLNPEALSETELNRAMLEGLLVRLGRGVMLLPDRQSQPLEVASPFYSEILEGHVGYLRLGAFNKANLQCQSPDQRLRDRGGIHKAIRAERQTAFHAPQTGDERGARFYFGPEPDLQGIRDGVSRWRYDRRGRSCRWSAATLR